MFLVKASNFFNFHRNFIDHPTLSAIATVQSSTNSVFPAQKLLNCSRKTKIVITDGGSGEIHAGMISQGYSLECYKCLFPSTLSFTPTFRHHSRYIKLWCCTKSLNHFKNWNAVNLRGKRERNIYVELWIVIFFRVQRRRRSERHSNGLLFRWNIFIGIGAFSTCISTHKFPWSSLNIKLNLIWLCICRIFQNWSGLCRDNSGQEFVGSNCFEANQRAVSRG